MPEIIRKVCMYGDPNVGKTSLVRRFVHGKYDDKYISTLGTVVTKKNVKTGLNDNLIMMIWDISGQNEFKRIHYSAFKNSYGGIAVCDLTRPETAKHLQDWMRAFRKFSVNDVPIMVFANKADLAREQETNAKTTRDLLDELGCAHVITSAKTGENVEGAFKRLAEHMMQRRTNDIGEPRFKQEVMSPPAQMNPSEFLDYIVISFCKVLGDEEMGMHVVRKQVKDAGIDFRTITKPQAEELISQLTSILDKYKGEEPSRMFNQDMIRNHANCTETDAS